MALSTRIPQEIIDAIIDEAYDHKPTLKQCSTVSHAFLPRSRRHLFRALTLYIVYPTLPLRNRQLLDLLSINPGLSRHIHQLTVIIHNSQPEWMPQDKTLPDVLCRLSSVRSLALEYDCSDYNTHPFSSLFTSAIRNVLRLPTIHTVNFTRLCPCRFQYSLLNNMANIKHVKFVGNHHTIKCTHCPTPGPYIPGTGPLGSGKAAPARLETLSLGGFGVEPFVKNLLNNSSLSVPTLSNLRELKIYGWRSNVFESAWEVMKVASESIESLVFFWPYGRSYKPPVHNPLGPIDLHILSNLRVVILYVPHICLSGDNDFLWWPWMVQILNNHAFPKSMEELGIAIETDFDDEWMMDPDCPGLNDTGRSLVEIGFDKVLDEKLSRERYPNLRKIHVELLLHEQHQVNDKHLQDSAPQWFPRLMERGLLSAGVSEVHRSRERRFSSVLSPI